MLIHSKVFQKSHAVFVSHSLPSIHTTRCESEKDTDECRPSHSNHPIDTAIRNPVLSYSVDAQPPGDIGGHRAPKPVKLIHYNKHQKSHAVFVSHSQSFTRTSRCEIESADDECPHTQSNSSSVEDHSAAPVAAAAAVVNTNFDNDVHGTNLNNADIGAAQAPLLFYYQNVRGLRSKITDFALAVSESPFDCIILTETWLDSQICSSQLFGSDYFVYRTDRSPSNSDKSMGGGVLIAVRRTLQSALLMDAMNGSLEQLWISIKAGIGKVVVGAIYIPPNLRNELEVIETHLLSMEKACDLTDHLDDLILFGDYNRPGLSWLPHPRENYLCVDALSSAINASSSCLLDGIALHGLHQINPVRNHNNRLLDLIFVNQQALPACDVCIAPDALSVIDSHHPPLMISFSRIFKPICIDEFNPNDYDFRRGNYDAINAELSTTDWTQIINCNVLDEAVELFTVKMQELIERHVPFVRPRRKPAWGNSQLRRLNRERKSTLRAYQRIKNPFNRARFTAASRKYKKLNKRLYLNYVQQTERSLRFNPKSFWRFVNTRRKENGLPSSLFLNDKDASTPDSKCNLFAEHFSGVFNNECATSESISVALQFVPSNEIIAETFTITDAEVATAIRKQKLSFSPGPDGIPAVLLKKCCEHLKLPISAIFNLSIQCHQFPRSWKTSYMFPVFKKGDRRNVEHYRGITSLCACSKALEAIVYEYLMFRVKNYLSTSQHGFFPGRSVSTNLLEFTSLCLQTMDRRNQVDAVYTDLKAAFDRVDHGILLAKLAKLGVSSGLVAWLASYLQNRRMAVKLGSSSSVMFRNNSGVPQGSTLGPLLFSLFINDVSRLLPPGTRLFYADDAKIYLIIRCIEDCLRLQKMIDLFAEWCNCNLMTICVQKCTVISFSLKKQTLLYDYHINGQDLLRSDVVTDLGVLLDHQLTFRPHYTSIISKANRQLGMILKIGKDFRDPGTLRTLYCSLVRSILETNCVVWDPQYEFWTHRIENVQKRIVRKICHTLPWRNPDQLPPYEDLCSLVGLKTLVQRRKDITACTAHKILVGVYDCPALLSSLQLHCPLRPQRHQQLLHIRTLRTNYGQHEPVRRLAIVYNQLSQHFEF